MVNEQQTQTRKEVFRILLLTTVVVLLVMGLAFLASRILPVMKQQRMEQALSSGNTALARQLAEGFGEEEKARILQECSYLEALELEKQGRYPEASALFAQAGSFEDAQERRRSCDYLQAELLEEQGNWDDAAEAFRALGSYRDAADRVTMSQFRKAQALLGSGQAMEAAQILDGLTGMPEAHELLVEIVTELTGLDEERALAAFHGMSEEQLALLSDLADLRAALPRDILDVGFEHTVGLGADGHVLSCGDNSFGQCETVQWSGAKAVAAGAYHTVALLADGTVKACGRNSEGQCNTEDWSGIVQIAAGDWATFGLRQDGSVVSTGFLDYEEIRDWSGMKRICAGSYGVAGIRNDGSVWFFPVMEGYETVAGAEELALNTGYAVGVKKDGSVVCSALDLSDWQSVLTVSAGSTAILALEAGGFVDARFFRESDRVDFSSVMEAVALAAGGTHHAVAFADGHVEVFGEKDSGQGDTSGWLLAVD